MIYNFSQTGINAFDVYYDIDIDSPYFLGVLKVPCYSGKIGQSESVLIPSVECGDYYTLTIDGVDEIDEDLLTGLVYFPNIGTWTLDLYYQDNDTNTDPNNATFLEAFELQVNYG